MRKVSHYYEKLSHYYEKVSQYNEKLSHYYEKVSQYNEILSHNYEKVSHYYDLQNYIFYSILAETGFHILQMSKHSKKKKTSSRRKHTPQIDVSEMYVCCQGSFARQSLINSRCLIDSFSVRCSKDCLLSLYNLITVK